MNSFTTGSPASAVHFAADRCPPHPECPPRWEQFAPPCSGGQRSHLPPQSRHRRPWKGKLSLVPPVGSRSRKTSRGSEVAAPQQVAYRSPTRPSFPCPSRPGLAEQESKSLPAIRKCFVPTLRT